MEDIWHGEQENAIFTALTLLDLRLLLPTTLSNGGPPTNS